VTLLNRSGFSQNMMWLPRSSAVKIGIWAPGIWVATHSTPGGGKMLLTTETLDALLALGLTGAVSTADQLGVYRVLLNHTGRRDLDATFERLLGPVHTEQQRHGVPLLDTLEQFLIAGRRPGAAAAALDIHVNTLYQRLATIDDPIGVDCREPDTLRAAH
jgi:PucR C-terminal helix-turn-helix domain